MRKTSKHTYKNYFKTHEHTITISFWIIKKMKMRTLWRHKTEKQTFCLIRNQFIYNKKCNLSTVPYFFRTFNMLTSKN